MAYKCPQEKMMKTKLAMFLMFLICLCTTSCSKDDDTENNSSNPLVGRSFYSSNSDGYKVMEFTSNTMFAYYETDKNFMQSSTKWTGFYTYDAKTKEIVYNNCIIYELVGLTLEQKKLLRGKYYGDSVTAEYVYKWGKSDEWSKTELGIVFYAKKQV